MSRNGQATLRDFLETALIPCGHTLYVWGGGWNKEDTGAGEDAVTLGESPQWRTFYEKNAEGYDYQQHRFCLGEGLDCSGFIGWALYNTLEDRSGRAGYVTKSSGMAQALAERGFGQCLPRTPGCTCLPGDIVSMSGHVYLSLGTCEDGSSVLLHSSPQAGVQISGTCRVKKKEEPPLDAKNPASGSAAVRQEPGAAGESVRDITAGAANRDSIGESACANSPQSAAADAAAQGRSLAFMAADAAMKKHFPQCHALFGTKLCGEDYLSGTLFRWDLRNGPLADAEGLCALRPDALLDTLRFPR